MENAQTVESVIENILKENALMGKLSNRKSPSRKCSNGKSPNRKLLNTNLMKNGPNLKFAFGGSLQSTTRVRLLKT